MKSPTLLPRASPFAYYVQGLYESCTVLTFPWMVPNYGVDTSKLHDNMITSWISKHIRQARHVRTLGDKWYKHNGYTI